MKKLLVAIGCMAVILVAGYVILAHVALSPSCSLAELAAEQSPDGKLAYSVFRKDCGATTDYVTGVALRPADRPLADDPANLVLIIEGETTVQPRWTSGNTLEIAVSPSANVFKKLDKWMDVKISTVAL